MNRRGRYVARMIDVSEMATRGVEFHAAATALARMAGTGELPDGSRMPARKIVEAAALAGRDLENWLEGVEYLRESEGEHAERPGEIPQRP